MSEKHHITRAAGSLGSATLISRIAGLIRDMVIASQFGAGLLTDAFFMAFTIPNLLRRFFAEGSLTAAFVPTFSDVTKLQGEAEARRVATICWTLLLLVMFIITLAGVIASPVIVKGPILLRQRVDLLRQLGIFSDLFLESDDNVLVNTQQ